MKKITCAIAIAVLCGCATFQTDVTKADAEVQAIAAKVQAKVAKIDNKVASECDKIDAKIAANQFTINMVEQMAAMIGIEVPATEAAAKALYTEVCSVARAMK